MCQQWIQPAHKQVLAFSLARSGVRRERPLLQRGFRQIYASCFPHSSVLLTGPTLPLLYISVVFLVVSREHSTSEVQFEAFASTSLPVMKQHSPEFALTSDSPGVPELSLP